MVEIHDVDENAPWRNDPDAKAAVMAARNWMINDRKGKESIRFQQIDVIAYGKILLKIRGDHPSNKEFNKSILARKLNVEPFTDFRERSAAMALAKAVIGRPDNSPDNIFAECEAKSASEMVRWARKVGLIAIKKKAPIQAHDLARDRLRAKVENGDPINREALADELNVSQGTIQRANLAERGRLEGITEGEANVLNAQGKFTKVQARHVEALARKQERHLNQQFNAVVEARVATQVAERVAALDKAREACTEQKNKAFQKEQYWQKLINNHKPLFTLEEFRTIVMALHPDNSASGETRARALQSVTDKKLQLTGKP